MKNVLTLLFILLISISCKKNNLPLKTGESAEPIEQINLIVPGNLNDTVEPQGDPIYNVIGYGYDVTGTLNDASSIRGNIVDVAAYVKREKPENFEPWTSTAFGHDSYDAENAVILAKKLSAELEITKDKGLYGGTISEFFPKTTAFSEKYVYGYYSEYLQYKSFRFFIDDELVANFRKYLNPLFQSDLQKLSPEMIVKKYGTHLLANIAMGAKLDIIYQAETVADDRSGIQRNGYDAAMKTTFGFWTSRFDAIDSAKLRKIKSPSISFRVAGGDPSKIRVIESAKGRQVDFNEWIKSAEKQNHVFIRANSIIPLFRLIADENKQTAVQGYITNYLKDNEVKLTK